MYLLIRKMTVNEKIFEINLHPTMYLLIPKSTNAADAYAYIFTSHYVSINSAAQNLQAATARAFTSHYVSINSR